MSTTFSANFGSFDSLNGRVRCGLRPCSFQTRCTVVWRTPISSANIRALQCVACLGFFLGCTLHDREPHLGTDRLLAGARALAPVLEQALDATIHVGFLPAPNRRLRYPSLALDAIRAEPATRQQHNACACNDFLRRLAISDEPLQCRPVTGPDVQACIDVSHAAVQSDLQALGESYKWVRTLGSGTGDESDPIRKKTRKRLRAAQDIRSMSCRRTRMGIRPKS